MLKTWNLTHALDVKNVNTKIDSFIPKDEMRQQIEFVSDFPFTIFCGFNK